jgi:hypothetical protein
MQQYAGIYLLRNYSTCFGRLLHPSSAAHQTVTAASGTGHSVRAAIFNQLGLIRPKLFLPPFILPPVLLQTISKLRSLLMACRKCIQ